MPEQIFIFRHGETFATLNNQWYWHRVYNASILPEYTTPIIKIGKYLKDIPTEYNVSSTFKRVRQTVEIVQHHSGKQFTTDKRLNELVFESPWKFSKRIRSFVHELDTMPYKSVAICTHGIVISALIHLITTNKIGRINLKTMVKPGVLVSIHNKHIEYIDFNVPFTTTNN